MRDNAVVTAPDLAEARDQRGHAGRPRCRRLTTGRVAWFLIAAIALPWLPIPEAPPGGLPMQRVGGRPGIGVWSSAFGADGHVVATSDARGPIAIRSAVAGWAVVRRIDVTEGVKAMTLSPDGHRLAVEGYGPGILLYDLESGDDPRPLEVPVRSTRHMRFSPDGRVLAMPNSCEITLWDLEAGRPRMTLRGHTGPVIALAYAPDGRSLASVGFLDQSILIWDLDTGLPSRRLIVRPTAVAYLAYSPDSRLLAVASPIRESVRIWDVRTGEWVRLIDGGPLPIRSVAFSPDGRLVATASADGSAGLWSVATGRQIRRLDGEAQLLASVAFSADGLTLLATANDEGIRLWDLGSLRSSE